MELSVKLFSSYAISIVLSNTKDLMRFIFFLKTFSDPIQEFNDLNFYGMGEDVRRAVFESFDISSLHEWQSEMLLKHIYEDGGMKNGLVLAPTSGGKTVVAIILMIRSMMLEQKDALLVLPYVAIVTEKVRELKKTCNKTGLALHRRICRHKGKSAHSHTKVIIHENVVCVYVRKSKYDLEDPLQGWAEKG